MAQLFEVRENITQFVDFFERVIQELERNGKSALARPNFVFETDLINTAKTPGKGQYANFEYYGVVDKGRDEVFAQPGKFLLIASRAGDVLELKEVAAAAGYEITSKSLGEVTAKAGVFIEGAYSEWVRSGANFSVGGRGVQKSTPTVDSADSEDDGGETAGQMARRMLRRSQSELNATKIVSKSLRSARTNVTIPQIPNLQSQDLSSIEKLIRASNLGVIGAIFLDVSEEAADVFRENTPSRKETGNFKLISAGGPPVVLSPQEGGSLKRGYRLVVEGELRSLANT